MKSTPGQGTRAEILLPISAAKVEAGARAFEKTAQRKPPPMKVLAVDDDPLILMNAVDMLEELGLTVVQASSGGEALSLMETEGFDLVITDHAMPKMTGAELMHKIRDRFPDMPLILATGYAELPTTAGLQFIRLPKPYTLDDLEAALAASVRT